MNKKLKAQNYKSHWIFNYNFLESNKKLQLYRDQKDSWESTTIIGFLTGNIDNKFTYKKELISNSH